MDAIRTRPNLRTTWMWEIAAALALLVLVALATALIITRVHGGSTPVARGATTAHSVPVNNADARSGYTFSSSAQSRYGPAIERA